MITQVSRTLDLSVDNICYFAGVGAAPANGPTRRDDIPAAGHTQLAVTPLEQVMMTSDNDSYDDDNDELTILAPSSSWPGNWNTVLLHPFSSLVPPVSSDKTAACLALLRLLLPDSRLPGPGRGVSQGRLQRAGRHVAALHAGNDYNDHN